MTNSPNDDNADIRAARASTARIRHALRDLPKAIAAEGFYQGHDKDDLREILQEIVGSATAIAELCDIEL